MSDELAQLGQYARRMILDADRRSTGDKKHVLAGIFQRLLDDLVSILQHLNANVGNAIAAQHAALRVTMINVKNEAVTLFFDIDTQIDFVYPAGALYVPGAEHILPVVAELNRRAPLARALRAFSMTASRSISGSDFTPVSKRTLCEQ